MSRLRIGPLDVARRAREAVAGGESIAVVLCVEPAAHRGARIIRTASSARLGTLGDPALDAAAFELAQRALQTREPAFTETVRLSAGDATLYVESFHATEHLIVVGAGHIAVPLARLGVDLGFRVTVLDDREAFATPERFPSVATVVRADFERDPFAGVDIDGGTCVVLVTRGHRWDFDCLRLLLESATAPRYIGMIGSRRRVRAAFHALLEAGYPRTSLATVRAPIGIEIGAETPDEIAVSIAAELIAVRRGVEIETIAGRERVLDRLLPGTREQDGRPNDP